MILAEQIAAAEADGFEIVQQGRVLVPLSPTWPKPSFVERVEGCDAGRIAPGDRLYADEERWVHLRRRRAS